MLIGVASFGGRASFCGASPFFFLFFLNIGPSKWGHVYSCPAHHWLLVPYQEQNARVPRPARNVCAEWQKPCVMQAWPSKSGRHIWWNPLLTCVGQATPGKGQKVSTRPKVECTQSEYKRAEQMGPCETRRLQDKDQKQQTY